MQAGLAGSQCQRLGVSAPTELPAEQIRSLHQVLSPFIQALYDQLSSTDTILKTMHQLLGLPPKRDITCYILLYQHELRETKKENQNNCKHEA